MTSFIESSRPTFLAANILSRRNEKLASPSSREEVESRCTERIQLSKSLQTIDPQNKTWEYAEMFFQTFPKGRDAVRKLSQEFGILNSRGELCPANGLEDAYPREFIDLDKETIEGMSNNIKVVNEVSILAENSRRVSLTQYDKLKTGLLNTGVPLLCKDYVSEMQNFLPNKPVCLIGLSADEAKAYKILARNHNIKSPLIGVNKGYSPAVEEMIKNREITELNSNRNIKSSDLNEGNVYITKANITKNLPLSPGEFKIGSLYVWHHIPQEEKSDLLKRLVDYSFKSPNGDVALAIFEPHRNPHLYKMVLETNAWLGNETAAFDALIGTTACGSQTKESFVSEVNNIAPQVNWSGRTYPNIPPLPAFHQMILPIQQTAVFGWKR